MAVSLNITNEWPSTLPLPFIDYAGNSGVATLHSSPDGAIIKRRSRQTRTHPILQVKWVFQKSEMKAFLAFWEDTLGDGTASFKIELRYPKNSDLDVWVVKFVADLDVSNTDHQVWEVSTALQIVHGATVDAKAAVAPYYFYVQNETTGGDPIPFCVIGEESDAADPKILEVQPED